MKKGKTKGKWVKMKIEREKRVENARRDIVRAVINLIREGRKVKSLAWVLMKELRRRVEIERTEDEGIREIFKLRS